MRYFLALVLILTPALALANGYETYPTPLVWSPDGTLLASVEANAWPYNDGLVAGTLRLYHFDGTPLHELLAGESVGSPTFSDSGLLACVHNGKIALFEGYLEPSSVRFIDTPKPVLDVTFSPVATDRSEAMLVSLGERFYGADVWRVSLDGGKFEQLTHAGPNGSAFAPLARDAFVAFFLQQPGYEGDHAYERLALYSDGLIPELQLTAPADKTRWPDEYHESNPVFLWSTGELFFQRGGWGDWDVLSISRAEANSQPQESLELTDAEQPSLSADGRWLAFVRRPGYAKEQTEYDWDVIPQIWLADRECRQLWHVTTSIAGGEFPALTRDGSRLAWIEYNDGRVRTVVREVGEITAGGASGTY